jgi:hypothetical protein
MPHGRSMTRQVWRALSVFLVFALHGVGRCEAPILPREVKVLPIFLVPKGEANPSDAQALMLMRHVELARARYQKMLPDHVTFKVATSRPRLFRSERGLSFYREQLDPAAQIVSELLAELKCSRYTCRYVLLVIVMNSADEFPHAVGRPLNGGYNTGGGVVVLSSFTLDRLPNFQSTLQHELGRSFGLQHVDVYGYDMNANASIMSNDSLHNTNGFDPSTTPAILIPEDIRGLALNQRAFPGARFDRARDVPKSYKIAERIVPFAAMIIPNQPDGPRVTTESGETFGSRVTNIVQGQILPDTKPGRVTFDGKHMWSSAKSNTGWVAVDVTFPVEVELTAVAIHSQHSGQYHPAKAVRILVESKPGGFQPVATADLDSVDATVKLPKTKGTKWRFEFQAGSTGMVVLRGLQFFAGDDELFPPLVPYQP